MRIALLLSYVMGLNAPCCFEIPYCLKVGTFYPLPDPDDSMHTVLVATLEDYEPYQIESEVDVQTLRILEKKEFLPKIPDRSNTCVPGELEELLIRNMREDLYRNFTYQGREQETGHPKFRMEKTTHIPSPNVIPIYAKNPFEDDKMLSEVYCCTGLYGAKCFVTQISLFNLLRLQYSPILCCVASSACPCLTLASIFERDLLKKGLQGWARILTFTCCGPGWVLGDV